MISGKGYDKRIRPSGKNFTGKTTIHSTPLTSQKNPDFTTNTRHNENLLNRRILIEGTLNGIWKAPTAAYC